MFILAQLLTYAMSAYQFYLYFDAMRNKQGGFLYVILPIWPLANGAYMRLWLAKDNYMNRMYLYRAQVSNLAYILFYCAICVLVAIYG